MLGFHSSWQLGSVIPHVKETPLPEAMAFRCKGDTLLQGGEGICMYRSQLSCRDKVSQLLSFLFFGFFFLSFFLVSLFDASELEEY